MAAARDRLQEIFEDLMSRFIINVPESEIANTDRICFQIEQAHWYYEDFIRDDPTAALATTTTQSDGSALPPLPGYTLKRFAAEMFERCPLIADLVKNPRVDTEEIYRRFVAYKMNVPVCGAIILNDRLDKILLVRGWTSKSWTFPKGKINQNETEVNCAIREVMEEIGFDVTDIIREADYIERVLRGEQRNRLYIIPGVSEDTQFCPQTRKEIADIKWHWLKELPGYKRSDGDVNHSSTKYYMVRNFIGELQKFVAKNKKKLRATPSKADSQSSLASASNIPSSPEDHTGMLKSMLGIGVRMVNDNGTSSTPLSTSQPNSYKGSHTMALPSSQLAILQPYPPTSDAAPPPSSSLPTRHIHGFFGQQTAPAPLPPPVFPLAPMSIAPSTQQYASHLQQRNAPSLSHQNSAQLDSAQRNESLMSLLKSNSSSQHNINAVHAGTVTAGGSRQHPSSLSRAPSHKESLLSILGGAPPPPATNAPSTQQLPTNAPPTQQPPAHVTALQQRVSLLSMLQSDPASAISDQTTTGISQSSSRPTSTATPPDFQRKDSLLSILNSNANDSVAQYQEKRATIVGNMPPMQSHTPAPPQATPRPIYTPQVQPHVIENTHHILAPVTVQPVATDPHRNSLLQLLRTQSTSADIVSVTTATAVTAKAEHTRQMRQILSAGDVKSESKTITANLAPNVATTASTQRDRKPRRKEGQKQQQQPSPHRPKSSADTSAAGVFAMDIEDAESNDSSPTPAPKSRPPSSAASKTFTKASTSGTTTTTPSPRILQRYDKKQPTVATTNVTGTPITASSHSRTGSNGSGSMRDFSFDVHEIITFAPTAKETTPKSK